MLHLDTTNLIEDQFEINSEQLAEPFNIFCVHEMRKKNDNSDPPPPLYVRFA